MNNWEKLNFSQVKQLQSKFIDWYSQNHRLLPWRIDRNPYRIWISEIMLQQTRVDTVIGYFERFMQRFPTIADLANADDDLLLKTWEGLGYYSRARNLKIAAQQIMQDFNGKFPDNPKDIAKLKGIGPYTAGAISSIAFGLAEPAIDGNVMRVVSRLFLIEDDIAKASSRKVFDQAVRKIIDTNYPGEFNQAFMDLGSSICLPTQTQCHRCPLADFCLAKQTNQQLAFPVKSKKMKAKHKYFIALAIQNNQGAFVFEKRDDERLLADMLHFPLIEVSETLYQQLNVYPNDQVNQQLTLFAEDKVAEEAAVYLLTQFSELSQRLTQLYNEYLENELSLTRQIIWQKRSLGEVKHIFTHLKWHTLLFYGRMVEETITQNQYLYTQNDLNRLPIPKIQHKWFEQLKKNDKL
ncbi:MAG TPA: A/G-specific adenine glycosylase [Enterococcus columbae]|nr:A/G-specific adenine glycosylase [Enterococcus columbae]